MNLTVKGSEESQGKHRKRHMRTRRDRASVESQPAEDYAGEEEEGTGGQGEKQSGKGTERSGASGYLCVCVEGRGASMAARGMCSLNQESLGAKTERSTSLPRERERERERAALDRHFCFYQHHHPRMGREQDHLACQLQQMRLRVTVNTIDHSV